MNFFFWCPLDFLRKTLTGETAGLSVKISIVSNFSKSVENVTTKQRQKTLTFFFGKP